MNHSKLNTKKVIFNKFILFERVPIRQSYAGFTNRFQNNHLWGKCPFYFNTSTGISTGLPVPIPLHFFGIQSVFPKIRHFSCNYVHFFHKNRHFSCYYIHFSIKIYIFLYIRTGVGASAESISVLVPGQSRYWNNFATEKASLAFA